MTKNNWTAEEMAAGYAAMAKLNLTLAQEFAELESEAAELIEQQWQQKK